MYQNFIPFFLTLYFESEEINPGGIIMGFANQIKVTARLLNCRL
jgi:hypothetical protein